ncbi:putative rad8 protein and Rdh54p [Rosellinia necatrix]|uniref:Putative rad8 protein and Rdh54p n=1 Tax=Rosellinia necatrix TaxID=77044 RepID=A0A1W2TLH6_ROSNE|nr:putative rad8 protein and Rdh54p [Rosellinia necatrix]
MSAIPRRAFGSKKKLGEEIKAYAHESFPNALLGALRALAGHTLIDTDGSNEPPRKRPRVDPMELDSIPVLQERFTISRPIGSCSPMAGQMAYNDAGHYLSFQLSREGLHIRSKAGAPCGPFRCVLHLDQSFPDTTLAALTVLHQSREDNTQEGALTVSTTVSLRQDNTMLHMHFTLDVNYNTSTYASRNTKKRGLSQHILNVLGEYKPDPSLPDHTMTANEFYQAAFVPRSDNFNDLSSISIPGLEATLYPFQRRAVQWLLMREHVKYSRIGQGGELQLVAHPQPPEPILPLSFSTANDVNGRRFYVSHLYHVVTRDVTPFQESETSLRGGILAEEMGLGKTVEIISLILAHKRGLCPLPEIETCTSKVIHITGATLIVTPDTLQSQWLSEFKKHAPGLLVIKYPGMKVWANDKAFGTKQTEGSLLDRLISTLVNCDVVITTYSVLQAELHYAMTPPERTMRYDKKHERHTSPLVQISWWRVCLDEAQQIDSGVSSAAKVACLIPRVNSWAVTGTPVKEGPNDLWGLLLFLHYEPFASCQFVWKALLKTHKFLFGPLFNRITIRHAKQAVQDELRLPSQKRYVITMPFTNIEAHHYHSHFRALIAKAGLNEQGIPFHADWKPDDSSVIDSLKMALASLRQTILHPELGSGIAKVAAYRTLAEHLDVMIEQSEASIRTHQRLYLISKLNRAQLLENSPRVKEALKVWEEVLGEVKPTIVELREELGRTLQTARQEQTKAAGSLIGEVYTDEETLETAKVGESRRKLRMFLELHHRVAFLIASALFQIKSDEKFTQPDSDEFKHLEAREIEGYELARKIRREILQEPLTKVAKMIEKIQARASTQSFVEIPEIITADMHGIESVQITEALENLSFSLNKQANIIDEWREYVIQLLLTPPVDAEGDEEVTGEEYEESAKVQDHLMVYTLALGAIIGDRQEALTGLVNERIRHETTNAERMAKQGQGHAPDKMLELLRVRRDAKPFPDGSSLRGVVTASRELSTKLRHDASAGSARAATELQIVNTQLRETQVILTKQSKAVASLERDLDFFTSAMNARVDFYRQLQSISENVAPIDPEAIGVGDNLNRFWDNALNDEAELKKKAEHWESNRRHLLYIKEEGSGSNDPCPICCSDDFIRGAITSCGHTFCKDCIVHWLKSKSRCPICKEYQTPTMLSEFNKNEAVRKGLSLDTRLQGGPKREWGVYTDIPNDIKHAIQNVKLHGPSYSTKVDTLMKHLLWLRDEEPGAKSIIFTQFRSFLRILEQALAGHYIGFATFTSLKHKSAQIQRFKDDPSVHCLLMDAKAHSSGLNLVNANHVFLCEPLLNTALELQATARVDRIGQEHETTVWLYLVEGTVEGNIHDLSERRRLAYMGGDTQKGKSKRPTEEEVMAASLREFQESDLTKLMTESDEGEVVNKGDLWECIFGRAMQV